MPPGITAQRYPRKLNYDNYTNIIIIMIIIITTISCENMNKIIIKWIKNDKYNDNNS